MDGQVIIGTKLDTKQLEKDLKIAERQLQQYEKEAEKLSQTKLKAESDLQSYEEEKKLLNEVHQEAMELAKTESERNTEIQEYNRLLEGLKQKYSSQLESLNNVNEKIKENTRNQGLTNNKVREFRDELNKAQGFSGIKNSIEDVGNSIERTIRKMSRWALSIFGIRSAYMFVRQEMGVLSGYNEQISTDIAYMRFAIATTLQPVIEGIIKLAYKLLTYIAYIAKAWFGVNIFAKASSKAFGEANNKVKATNKSAKQLQKTLAGFDEMNILQENGGVGTGGGGGGIPMPSVDLSEWDKIKIPGWIDWIAKNKNLILSFLEDIASWFITVKIASFFANLTGIFTIMRNMQGLSLFALVGGLAITVLGIYETIKNLIKWIGDPTWENFYGVLSGLETILIGVGTAMIALNATNPLGWITLAIGAVGKLVTSLINQKESTDDLREAETKLKDARKKLLNATDEYVDAVDSAKDAQDKLRKTQEDAGMTIDELLSKMEAEGLTYEDLTDDKLKNLYKAYVDNENAQQRLIDSKKKMKDATRDEGNASLDHQRILSKEKGSYDELKQSIIDNFEQGKITAKDARIQIAQAMDGMDYDAKKTFVDGIPKKIMSTFDTNKYQGKWNTFEYWWNKSLSGLKDTLTLNVSTKISTTFQDVVSSVTSKTKKSAKGSIIYPTKIPKLASGGIINQPGRGVAIGGERGAEAVVPLTDSQQMSLLGEAIGRYITVELTNVTQLDGRQIARKVEQINQNNKFVLNR